MKDFISLLDYSHEDLTYILDRADVLCEKWSQNEMPSALGNQQIGLWFYGQGFRNRMAFEIGVRSMRGEVSYIPGDLGKHEPLEDIGHYLENWFSMLVVRAANHSDLTFLAAHTSIPIINARTNYNHPCEIMGDLQFIRKQRGTLNGLNVVFMGEASNMCMSWFEAAARFPIRVTQIAPQEYLVPQKIIQDLKADALGEVGIGTDLEAALADASLIYTDCWPKPNETRSKEAIREQFLPYQITGQHLAQLHEDAIFLPCPPVTRGEEVSADAMQSTKCMNYQAKNYLLHSQNAIMELIGVRG